MLHAKGTSPHRLGHDPLRPLCGRSRRLWPLEGSRRLSFFTCCLSVHLSLDFQGVESVLLPALEQNMELAIHTLGCKLNQSETSAVASTFEESGFQVTTLKEVEMWSSSIPAP